MIVKSFILCLQFLTRLYLPFNIDGPEDLFARGLAWFPVAGLILGVLEAVGSWLTSLVFGPAVCVVFWLLLDAFLTGGLHLDGLADTVDGLSSHRSKERMLEIMKDSRIGTFGVLAIVGLFLAKGALCLELTSLDLPPLIFYGILGSVPVLGRFGMALLVYTSRYAREEGMGGLFFAYKKSMNLPLLLILGILSALAALRHPVLAVMTAAGLLSGFLVRCICYRKIDGMTGDTLGAALEIMETVVLIAAVIFMKLI